MLRQRSNFQWSMRKFLLLYIMARNIELETMLFTRKDGQESNTLNKLDCQWTWKTKITLLFRFRGLHQSFFHALWFKQIR
jgi:hypothetical protein